MLEVGAVIGGRFRVDRVIGRGGFGVVVAATHIELRQQVAIKMMRDDFVGDTEIIERFLREARAVAVLRTDHVCRVNDVARTEDGTPYIVMDLLEGQDVFSMLNKGPLPVATAVDFVVQACIALAEAHPRGIVHRDLKPPNLFVTRRPDGSPLVKLLDFGVAKAADELRLTHTMAMLGSPQYMSPEQMTTPKDVDARTDIWSLGVTLYHMLSNRLPFPSAQIGELAVMITTAPPAPIDIDPGLRTVLFRCLEKDRAARFQDVGALAAALAPFGTSTTQGYAAQTRPTGAEATPISIATAPPRNRVMILAPLAVLLVGGALLATFLLMRGSEKKDSPEVAAPAETKPVETKPVEASTKPRERKQVETKPSEPATVVTTPSGVQSDLDKTFAEFEQRIKDSDDQPTYQQNLIYGAAGMACSRKDLEKARAYVARLLDKEQQALVRKICSDYGITL